MFTFKLPQVIIECIMRAPAPTPVRGGGKMVAMDDIMLHAPRKRSLAERFTRDIKRNKYIYLMIIPVAAWYLLFCYLPMYGIVIAFQDYNIVKGIFGSPWLGLENFKVFFTGVYAGRVTFNTVYLNILGLIFGFPAPIIFALLLNEISMGPLKKIFQTISYLPFFISLVVVCGLIRIFCAKDGAISYLITLLTGKPVLMNLFDTNKYYRTLYIFSDIWKDIGMSSIIYLSAISSINPEIYEAAVIDGAGRWARMRYITFPGITSTIVMLFILALGGLMGAPLEKPLLLMNPANSQVSDLISTYVYRQGLTFMQFGYGAAVGLFGAVINFIVLFAANKTAGKLTGYNIF